MQQHSGQHLLSAVFEELYGMKTVSFHLGAECSTIDLETGSLTREQACAAEDRANAVALECRAVGVQYEDAATAGGLRKATERAGTLRIVTIDGLDRSACGGTHVRTTGEIGPTLIRKLDKIRGNTRVEFLCGRRAMRRSRADYEALSAAARRLGAGLDEVPQLVEALQEQAKESALRRGAELFAAAGEDAAGLRRHVERAAAGLNDELRALAQGFTAAGRGVFIGACDNPPAVLYAASAASGIHAGNRLKEALAAHGGRGGGNAQLAQGSLPGDYLDDHLRQPARRGGAQCSAGGALSKPRTVVPRAARESHLPWSGAIEIKARPTKYSASMITRRHTTPGFAPLNSRHTSKPHRALISVAPWPSA